MSENVQKVHSKKKRARASEIAVYVVLGIGTLIMLYPLIFAVFGSIVSMDDFYGTTILPLPKDDGIDFSNFAKAFTGSTFYQSVLVTLARVVWYGAFLLFTSMLGGYIFSLLQFKGRTVAFYIILSSMMIPGVALMMPQYVMLARFPLVGGNDIFGQGGSGFVNNPAVLFITGLFSAYNIFLVRQTLLSIGREYKEAAEVDGAGFFCTVFRIYMPMIKPVIAVIFLNLFIGMWNDYLFPLMFLAGNSDWHPTGLAIVNLIDAYLKPNGIMGRSDYPAVFGISLMMMLPCIIVFIAAQKYFIAGLTLGGVKG